MIRSTSGIVGELFELTVGKLGDLAVDQAKIATELAANQLDVVVHVPAGLQDHDDLREPALLRPAVQCLVELGVVTRGGDAGVAPARVQTSVAASPALITADHRITGELPFQKNCGSQMSSRSQ